MSRPLTIRKPSRAEIRQLHRLWEDANHPPCVRQAEAVLLYAAGLNGVDIADLLDVHPNTVYTDLHGYEQYGLDWAQQLHPSGPPPRITPAQAADIWQLAEQPPYTLGMRYGRWTLSTFRDYLVKRKVVKTISRELLRRVLETGGCIYAGCSASKSVPTPAAAPFCAAFVRCGVICPARDSRCFSMFN